MPNSEISNETKSRQLTGSSKRKRKQSIKRNIVKEDESWCSNSSGSPKVEKTYGKRNKGGKIKSGKDEEAIIVDIDLEGASVQKDLQLEPTDEDNSSNLESESNKNETNICELGSADSPKCSSNKSQCLNCQFCSEHKTSRKEVDTNKRIKKKFPCEICCKEGFPKEYNSVEKHKQHMASVHEIYTEEVKRFECTECPEAVWFPTKSKFNYHLGTKHPGIIKFVCEICTETFKLKANYKNHLKTHNIVVQKKFSCDVCNGTFVNKAGYEAHKKRFPGPHIKQSCSHCGFSFSKEKHLLNHRCKTLLLEEAATRSNKINSSNSMQNVLHTSNSLKLPQSLLEIQEPEESIKMTQASADLPEDSAKSPNQVFDVKRGTDTQIYVDKAVKIDTCTNAESQKKAFENDSQINKRVVLHRIIPKRCQDQTIYRPVQMQAQNIPESVVVQELREIDFEGGTFIATSSGDTEQQFIVRDINGHLVQGNQILQLDINDVQQGEESQVYLADWNIVAPYVIREKSP